MAEGLIFRDSADNRVVLEYSDEVPPTAPVTWNVVAEVKEISQNPVAATEIDLTHFGSAKKEFRLGLADDGGYDAVANLVPTETSASAAESQITVMSFAETGARRWWRITLPKAVATSSSQFMRQFDGGVQTAALGLGGTEDAFALNFTIRTFGSVTDSPETRAP